MAGLPHAWPRLADVAEVRAAGGTAGLAGAFGDWPGPRLLLPDGDLAGDAAAAKAARDAGATVLWRKAGDCAEELATELRLCAALEGGDYAEALAAAWQAL